MLAKSYLRTNTFFFKLHAFLGFLPFSYEEYSTGEIRFICSRWKRRLFRVHFWASSLYGGFSLFRLGEIFIFEEHIEGILHQLPLHIIVLFSAIFFNYFNYISFFRYELQSLALFNNLYFLSGKSNNLKKN